MSIAGGGAAIAIILIVKKSRIYSETGKRLFGVQKHKGIVVLPVLNQRNK